jgi:hypothetical protein
MEGRRDPYDDIMEDEKLEEAMKEEVMDEVEDEEDLGDRGYDSEDDRKDDRYDDRNKHAVSVHPGQKERALANLIKRNKKEHTLKELLTLGFNAAVKSGKPTGKQVLARVMGGADHDYDMDEVDDIEPWEFEYDENYDPDRDRLDKFIKTREILARGTKTAKQLMREINEEWDTGTNLVTTFINALAKKKNIKLDNKKEKVGMDFINLLFDSCPAINIPKPIFVGNEVLYNWIDTWKEITSKGGRGLVIKGKMFAGMDHITSFRDKVTQAVQENKDHTVISTQLNDLQPDYILPIGSESVVSLIASFQEGIVENELFKQIGQIVIQPSPTTLEDLAGMISEMGLNNEYTIENLTNDLQDKMKLSMNDSEKRLFANNLSRISKDKSSVFLKDMFYGKDGKPLITREPTTDDEINRLAVFMDDLSLQGATEVRINDDDNPYAVGVKKIGNVISSTYSETLTFVKPYRDPHFTFLNGVVETWSPIVHYVTGLPVFTQKDEVLRYKQLGKVVYLKIQETYVKVGDKNIAVMYFRKFLDFLDYLKSWQETYVRKIVEINNKLRTISIEMKIDKLSTLIARRDIMIKKVRDIKNYFIAELKSGRQISKMEVYLNDMVVENVITPSEYIDGVVVNYIANHKKRLIKRLTDDYESVGDKYEKLLSINKTKNVMKFFVGYFPDSTFSNLIEDTKKEQKIAIDLAEEINIKITLFTEFISAKTKFEDIKTICTNAKEMKKQNKLFLKLQSYYWNYISLFEKYLVYGNYKNRNDFKELEVSWDNKLKLFDLEVHNFVVKAINSYNKKDNTIQLMLQTNNNVFNLIDNACLLKTEDKVMIDKNEELSYKMYELQQMNKGNDKLFDLIYNTALSGEDIQPSVKLIHDRIVATLTSLNKLLDSTEEELKIVSATPLQQIPNILILTNYRYEVKKYGKTLYDHFVLESNKVYYRPELTTKEKIKGATLAITSRMFPEQKGKIPKAVVAAKDAIIEYDKEHKVEQESKKKLQEAYTKTFARFKLGEYTKYVSGCSKTERSLYDIFFNMRSEVIRKAKLQSRIRDSKDNDFYNTYRKIMLYLSGCIPRDSNKK